MFSPSSSARSNTLKLTGQYTGEYPAGHFIRPGQKRPSPSRLFPTVTNRLSRVPTRRCVRTIVPSSPRLRMDTTRLRRWS